MSTILNITGPIFIIIALGFVAVQTDLLSRNDMKGLGGLVINFAMPALLFNAMAKRSLTELVNIELLLVYALGSFAVVAAVLLFAWLSPRRSLRSGAILAMGVSLSNSAFIGFPLAQQLIGKEASAMLALYVTVEVMMVLPLLLTLAEIGGTNGDRWTSVLSGVFKRLLKNPMILAIVSGMAFSASGLNLPPPVARVIEMLANAAAPVALFFIGGTLSGLRLKGMGRDIGAIVVGKLALHPLAVSITFFLLPFDDPRLQTAAIINAGMPMLSIYPLLGQKYDQQDFCTAAMIITTVMSFFTISTLLWLTGAGQHADIG